MYKIDSKMNDFKQERNWGSSQYSRSKQSHSAKRAKQIVAQKENINAKLVKLQIELQLYVKGNGTSANLEKTVKDLKGKEIEVQRVSFFERNSCNYYY